MERIEPVFTAIITMRSLQTWLTFLLLSVVGVVAASTRAGSVSSRSRRMAPFRVGAATPPTGTNRKQQQPSPQEAFSSWVKTLSQTVLDARRHLTAAAVARSTSIVVMYPADVFKTRLQMQQANPFRLSGGLFNGVGSSLLGQVPYGVLTFGSYELYKDYFLKNERFANVQPIFKYALAAVLGDLTGSGWLCTWVSIYAYTCVCVCVCLCGMFLNKTTFSDGFTICCFCVL